MLILPAYGDHAAWPVSSYKTISTLGAPFGAFLNSYGPQSAFESRTSSLIVPLNVRSLMRSLLTNVVFGSPISRTLRILVPPHDGQKHADGEQADADPRD